MSTTDYKPPAGWYPNTMGPEGSEMYWDGNNWRPDLIRAAVPMPHPVSAAHHSHGPMTHGSLNVNREVYYTRQQKDHSAVLHTILALCTAGLSLPWTIYYAVSPNHYFHA